MHFVHTNSQVSKQGSSWSPIYRDLLFLRALTRASALSPRFVHSRELTEGGILKILHIGADDVSRTWCDEFLFSIHLELGTSIPKPYTRHMRTSTAATTHLILLPSTLSALRTL